MDQRTAIERDTLISYFPNLEADGDFVITSPSTYDYNCIAWALGYNNKWLWPLDEDCDILDGVEYWPDGLPRTEDIGNIIEAFKMEGYELCSNCNFEQGYTKVALYSIDCKATHAARQLDSGKWTSKLGPLNDITHGTPFSIEGDMYGKVHCIMKRPEKY